MSAARALGALARGAAKRPLAVVLVAAVLGAAGAGLAVGLRPSASAETFVGKSSSSYRATQAYYKHFGQEPIEVLVHGNLRTLLLDTANIERLAGLEGCIAGKVPARALANEGGTNGPCGQLKRMGLVKFVIGPGTFVAEAAEEIDRRLETARKRTEKAADDASRDVREAALEHGRSQAEAETFAKKTHALYLEHFAAELLAIRTQYGLEGVPSLEEHSFVSKLVFDSSSSATPKSRFAYLFPSSQAALISVRLKSGVSPHGAEAALAEIRKATAMPEWHLSDASYLITGEPAIVAELSSSITHSILLLLVAVALVMALVLSLVFRGRPRLLPLALALLATALTFGGLSASGAGLSIGEVAVLPVLVGLAVDYAIQLHSRVSEALAAGEIDVRDAVVHAASTGGPSIAAAAAASGAAMLVLELSPVPTVRDFATLLVIGLAVALLCVVTAGSAAIVLLARRHQPAAAATTPAAAATTPAGAGGGSMRLGRRLPAGALRRPLGAIGGAWGEAQEILRDNALTRLVSRAALGGARRWPRRALAVGVLLAAIGFALFGDVPVQTDITKLVPQNMPSLRNLATLENLSGVGGEIDLMVSSKDVSKSATIEWMSKYESTVLKHFGYSASRGCGRARLCPAFSLPDLFKGFDEASEPTKLTAAEVSGLLAALPPYFSQDVITASRRFASLAFGVRLMPLREQQRMIEAMRSSLKPPAGVHAQLVGLPVLAAQASAAVGSTSRRVIELLAGLAAVALVLLLAFRGDAKRALVPLLPVTLASGWSALLVFLLGVPLNPMSVTLSALTIAISTEFSVLLSERYRSERSAGWEPDRALARAWSGTGAAIAASGVTAIAGFGVLTLSDIAMLRDFGLVTLVDLTVSLLGVLLLLPATMLMADDGTLWRLPIAFLRATAAAPRRAAVTLSPRRWRRTRHGTSA